MASVFAFERAELVASGACKKVAILCSVCLLGVLVELATVAIAESEEEADVSPCRLFRWVPKYVVLPVYFMAARHILQIAWVLSNFPSFFVNPKCCQTLDLLQVLGTSNSNRHGNTLPDTPPTPAKLGQETSRETATDSSGDESALKKQLERGNLSKYKMIGHKSLVTFLNIKWCSPTHDSI